MSIRRGFTLIEMLAVITVSGVVLGLAVMLLHVMLSSERTGRQQFIADESAVQLADSLRRDVRAAIDAEVADGDESPGATLILSYDDDRQVDYVVAGREITRTRTTGREITAREVFGLRRLGAAQFGIAEAGTARIVSLELTRRKAESASGRRAEWPALWIDAALAADHRYVTSGGEEEDGDE